MAHEEILTEIHRLSAVVQTLTTEAQTEGFKSTADWKDREHDAIWAIYFLVFRDGLRDIIDSHPHVNGALLFLFRFRMMKHLLNTSSIEVPLASLEHVTHSVCTEMRALSRMKADTDAEAVECLPKIHHIVACQDAALLGVLVHFTTWKECEDCPFARTLVALCILNTIHLNAFLYCRQYKPMIVIQWLQAFTETYERLFPVETEVEQLHLS